MTLTQLEYIVALDAVKHFAKAAEKCHITQPSLSMQFPIGVFTAQTIIKNN